MHVIRLRDPWETERVAGSIRYRRGFGLPTNLGPQQRVWLVVAVVAPTVLATLNGQPIHPADDLAPRRFDITGQLVTRNELVLEVPAHDGPLGDVRLEIED